MRFWLEAVELEKKMGVLGIGPKLIIFTLPYLALGIIVTAVYPDLFKMNFLPNWLAFVLGAILTAAGLTFYLATVKIFLPQFKKGVLIQNGTFAWCRNPIYASFIIFYLPAAAFFSGSWFILSCALVLYGIFKLLIKEENRCLADLFGDEYRRYQARVNEILPWPPAMKSSASHKIRIC